MNKWKIGFWILLVIYIFTTGILLYNNLDKAVTIAYMKDGYENTEQDLEQLSQFIKGRLYKSDFKDYYLRNPNTSDSSKVELNRIKITFDKNGKVDSVTTIW
jgi:hypothetical protein